MSDTPILDLEKPLGGSRGWSWFRFFVAVISMLVVVTLAPLLKYVDVPFVQVIYRAAAWWLAPWNEVPPLGLAYIPFFSLCWVAMVVVHEAGHIGGAVLLGWKPLSVQAAGVLLDGTNGRWKIKFSPKALLIGWATAAPECAVAFSRKLRWFAIAGPTANIFAAIICRPLAHSAHGYTREVLMECASLSLLIAAINLLPLRIGRAETDGYIAFRGSRNRAWLESRMAAAMIAKSIRAGTSIEQCKTRWFSKTQPAGKPYLQQLPATLQHYARLVKMEQYEDAAIMLERALTIAARGGPHTKAIVFLLAACFQAEVRRSPDRANAWKTKIPSGKWLNPYQKTLLESSFAFCRGDRDTFITLRRQALLEFEEEPETPLRATTMARWEENTERMLKRLEASDAESAAASS